LGWRGRVAFPPPVGPPRGGSVLFLCAAVRVTVACIAATARLSADIHGFDMPPRAVAA
jgi:hypothetical protein